MRCSEKKRYLSEAAAMMRVDRTVKGEYRDFSKRLKRSKSSINDDKQLGAYLCSHCSFYHVGHNRRYGGPEVTCYGLMQQDYLLMVG